MNAEIFCVITANLFRIKVVRFLCANVILSLRIRLNSRGHDYEQRNRSLNHIEARPYGLKPLLVIWSC